jgi:hypothetical protein
VTPEEHCVWMHESQALDGGNRDAGHGRHPASVPTRRALSQASGG